jgi:hypothetical protein
MLAVLPGGCRQPRPYPPVPSQAPQPTTATHTRLVQVCEDLRTILRIEGCELFRSSINRPNLFYEASGGCSHAALATAACPPALDRVRAMLKGGGNARGFRDWYEPACLEP